MGVREKELIDKIRLDMQSMYDCRLFRRQSALVPLKDESGIRYIRFNYTGQADLDGFVKLYGVPCFLAIEAKSGNQTPSREQLERQMAFSQMGVIYHFVYEKTYEKDMDDLRARLRAYEVTMVREIG